MTSSVRSATAGQADFGPTLQLRLTGLEAIEEPQAASTAPEGTHVPWPLAPETVIDFYLGNPWLCAIGGLNADAISRAKVVLRARESDRAGRPVTNADPSEYARGMSWLGREDVGRDGLTTLDIHGLLRASVLHLDTTGNLFLEVVRDVAAKGPMQLAVLLPQFVRYEVQPDRTTLYQMDPVRGEYRFGLFGTRKTATDPREILHQRLPNLVSSVYGLPAWVGARDSVEVDNAHRKYIRNFFGNHAAPRWLLEVTQDPAWAAAGQVVPDQLAADAVFEQARAYLNANRGEMAGRNLILRYPGGILVKVTALDVKIEDPTFGATARNARDEIMAVRHTSLINLGLPEGGYRATAGTQSDDYRTQVLEPFAAPAVAALNRVLHADAPHGLAIGTWDVALEFGDVEDTLKQIEAIVKGTGAPIMTPNEGRQLLGYEPIKGDLDVVYISASLVPTGEVRAAGPDAGDRDLDEDRNEERPEA